jgi:PAS domain S-box-containing protein
VLRAVVDDAPMAIVSADLALKITRWNPAAERLFGWTAAEMLGSPYPIVVPEDRVEEHLAAREAALRGQAVSTYETRRSRKDGSQIDVTVSLGALHADDGSVQGFVAMLADITERRRLEERLLRSQKLEAVGQLAGGIAHDFNNILTAIMSYSQLLLDDMPVPDERRVDVLEIRRAAERAGSLTRQLLAFSKQQVVKPRTVSLNAVVTDIEKMLRRLVREDIDLVVSLDPTASSVEADPGQLEQVLVNLVVNARDAIPEGGRILIETARADQQTRNRVELSVSDTGTGMTEDVQRRIFEPFFTTKEPGRGTGLGLATVYGIVEQAGGEISVHSEVGTGTRFSILLPRVTGRVAATLAHSASATAEARGGKEIILLVEDDDAVRDVTRRVLTRQGYNVLEARRGNEGLSIMASQEGAIDLVVTDMVMPEMSGAELATRLRGDYPELRILFMSGYSRDATQQLLPFDRHSAFLEKPFSPGRLTQLVRELLDG